MWRHPGRSPDRLAEGCGFAIDPSTWLQGVQKHGRGGLRKEMQRPNWNAGALQRQSATSNCRAHSAASWLLQPQRRSLSCCGRSATRLGCHRPRLPPVLLPRCCPPWGGYSADSASMLLRWWRSRAYRWGETLVAGAGRSNGHGHVNKDSSERCLACPPLRSWRVPQTCVLWRASSSLHVKGSDCGPPCLLHSSCHR